MINEIISGICVAINSEFGDDYEIYKGDIEQGLKEPCFSIVCLNPTINQVLGKRYFRNNQFCIHYFPGSSDKMYECYYVAERLMNALEIINVSDDLCRGTSMYGQFTDGMLHFFVNYDMYVYKGLLDKEASMESVSYSTDVKG